MNDEKDLETLIDLDGVIIEQAGGYWTKFVVQRVAATDARPHGIRYSLTLHDKYGTRIMGFDNAHAVKSSKKNEVNRYDHRHRHADDEGLPYKFISAHQLLEDFWREVDRTLKMLGIEEVKE